MGLDMYLYVSDYVSGFDFRKDEDKAKLATIAELVGLKPAESSPHVTIELCVAYWRKANAIHGWFVREVQGGRDECQRSYVPLEKLQELRDACSTALALIEAGEVEDAQKLLTPTRGFFFSKGGDDLEWYTRDLEDTVAQLEPLLEEKDKTFYYQSSW